MKYKTVVHHNGNIYKLTSDKYETRQQFLFRIEYILNNINNNTDINILLINSRKESNKYFYKVSYD